METRSGIGPVDERLGGLRPGSLYLLAGSPGAGKLVFVLQFLSEGLDQGERVALLCGYEPQEILEQSRLWGLDVEGHWGDGSLVLLGFRGEYPRRILHAPEPAEAFRELEDMLDGPVDRLGIIPGTLLWETRAGTAMAHEFLRWTDDLGATTVATLVSDLRETPAQATEWVLQRAGGVFHLSRLPSGLRELSVHRFHPPAADPGPITLELAPGKGYTAPSGRIGRRRSDPARGAEGRMLLLQLGARVPDDLDTWLHREYEVSETSDALNLVAQLPRTEYGVVCIYFDRSRTDEALQVCRTARSLTQGAVVLISAERLRSSDRTRGLEAGADDVLTQEVSLRELGSRLQRATMCVGERPGAESQPIWETSAELLDETELAATLHQRMDSPSLSYFTLVRIAAGAPAGIEDALRECLRSEAGDLLGSVDAGLVAVLQDARAQHAEAFVARVAAALARRLGADAELSTEVMSSPDDAERIRALFVA